MNFWECKKNDILHINKNDVHIWRVNLSDSAIHLHKYEEILNEYELVKANKFFKKIDKNRFTVGRAVLKILLARYLNIRTKQLIFEYSKYHKPFLSEKINANNLKFNLSHAGNWLALVFSLEDEIGVDIEEYKNDFEMEESAKLVFSLAEYEAWLDLPRVEKCASFFHVWSCKEAIIKALGFGFYYPSENITVSIDPKKECEVIKDKNSQYPITDWTLEKFYVDKNYSGAFAVKKKNMIPKYFDWKVL